METIEATKAATLNETLKTIYERRAVRKYTDKPVSRELIEQLLEAGRMAPSAINKQPWKFYILTKKDTIKTFSDAVAKAAAKHVHLGFASGILNTNDAIFHGAPVVIFITAPKDNKWASLDVGMCAQNIMLAAKSLGLDSCPVGMGKYVEEASCFEQLKVPKKETVLLSIIIGYGNDKPAVHERNKKNCVYIDNN
jgi:nitroreductase